ncbi:hypothetical protein AB5I41_22615 [Sphingomonas sp. MMS24-JH45]
MQALLYLTTPFIALPVALLGRAMDFRAQAKANMAAALAAALTALGGAIAGWGVSACSSPPPPHSSPSAPRSSRWRRARWCGRASTSAARATSRATAG